MSWLRASGADVRLTLHIQPRASRTGVVGPHGEALKIRLAAPPVDGAANAALIDYLAEQLEVARAAIALVAGSTGRRKVVVVKGVGIEVVRARLGRAHGPGA